MTAQESIKPFSWGFAAGALAVAVVAFSANWVVTASARDRDVRAAWVEGQAAICATLAQAHRKSTGDASDLYGYMAREARDKLAKSFVVVLPGRQVADSSVVNACSDMLDRKSAGPTAS